MKVSVIIPVYNTAPYLRRCLDSVTGQTLRDIEIICVNDASQDDSLHIIQKIARNDPRITVIDLKENVGETRARNIALEKATGDYIGFVDSDDYVDLCYFEYLYTSAINEYSDIAKCNRKTVEIDGKISLMEYNHEINKNKFFFNKGFTTAIYHNDMLKKHKIQFPEGITNHGDIVFLIKAVYWANRIATVDNAWYYCEKRAASSSWRISYEKRLTSCFSAAVLIVDFLNTISIDKESYNFIAHEEIVSLYRQGYSQKSVDAAKYCIALFSQCKYKDEPIAGLPAEFFKLLKQGNVYGLTDFYSYFSVNRKNSQQLINLLRSQVKKTMS